MVDSRFDVSQWDKRGTQRMRGSCQQTAREGHKLFKRSVRFCCCYLMPSLPYAFYIHRKATAKINNAPSNYRQK